MESIGSMSESSGTMGKSHDLILPTCKCGNSVLLKTSWTELNPSRRWLECSHCQHGGCTFWRWYDEEICDRAKNVIPGLLRKSNRLRSEIGFLENENETLKEEVHKLQKKIGKMEIHVSKLKEQLKSKNNKKSSVYVVVCILSFVIMFIWLNRKENGKCLKNLELDGY